MKFETSPISILLSGSLKCVDAESAQKRVPQYQGKDDSLGYVDLEPA